jgi:hypothetical protein
VTIGIKAGDMHIYHSALERKLILRLFSVLIGVAILPGFVAVASGGELAPPSGHITIMRTVPAHNAFRAGDIGEPTNIATAREDLVVGSTRTVGPAVESLSDAALSNVGGKTSGPGNAGATADRLPGGVAGGAGLALQGMGSTLGVGGAGAMQTIGGSVAGIGNTISHSLAPLNAVMSAIPGAK